jgi:hypothetical protein
VGISVDSALATIYVLFANFQRICNVDMVKALPLFSSFPYLQLMTPEGIVKSRECSVRRLA